LTFNKENGSGGISGREFNFLESFERRFGQSAEKRVASKFADEAIFDEFQAVWRSHWTLRKYLDFNIQSR